MNTNLPIDENAELREPDRDFLSMLYVMQDPTLDRNAFELRLATDPQLAESVSNAVAIVFEIRNQSGSRESGIGDFPMRIPASASSPRMVFEPARMFLATLAVVVAVILLSIPNAILKKDFEPLQEVASAWTDIQIANAEFPNEAPVSSLNETDDGFFHADPRTIDNDLPEWMLLATIVSDSMNSETIQ